MPRDAGDDQIRTAYRALARTFHPDVSDAADAAARFAEISVAYDVLSNPETRLLYDYFGYRGRNDRILDVARRHLQRGGERRLGRRYGGVRFGEIGEIEVGFLQAAKGARKKLTVPAVGDCLACRGTGAERSEYRCLTCHGTGRVTKSAEKSGVRLLEIARCSDCEGTGDLRGVGCSQCGGSGRVETERRLTVQVPPGVHSGQRIQVGRDELGAPLPGGVTEGYVVVQVRPLPADSQLVRNAAVGGLVLAVLFLLVLLFFA